VKSNDLKPGNAVRLDNQLYVVRSTEHVKPGKGPAYVQAKLKTVPGGSITDKRFRAAEEVEQVDLDRREMEYLYADASGYVFMDNETFEQVTLDGDLVADAMQYLKPNTNMNVLFYEGNPISYELPSVVDLQVTDTAPQPKGATATNQLKEAELETGLKTRVPPFIDVGETVRINTEDASYVSRV